MENQNAKGVWTEAANAGLILGGISVLYLVLTHFTGKLSSDATGMALLISVLNVVLWVAKFVGCIMAMRALMKAFAAKDSERESSDVFKFGVRTALLSALIYSACSLAYMQFFAADMIAQTFDTIMQSYSSMLDSNSLDALEGIKGKMPQIAFFSNLIYCFIYGTILSAILSRNIPSRNPFENE